MPSPTRGLLDRVDLHTCRVGEEPPPDLLARCEGMLAGRAAPGVLARAPRLRWIQALTAGVEGWLALPDLPAHVALTGARGTHRIAMPENILGALFHLTKPYAAAAQDQRERRWTRRLSVPLAGKTLGILGLGAIGVEVARKAAALEMSVIGVRRVPEPVPHVDRVYGPAEADQVLAASDFVLLLLPVTPETRGYMSRGAARADEAERVSPQLRPRRADRRRRPDRGGESAGHRGGGARRLHHRALARRAPVLGDGGHHRAAAYRRRGTRQRDLVVAELFVENLSRFLDGRPLLHAVDRARGY